MPRSLARPTATDLADSIEDQDWAAAADDLNRFGCAKVGPLLDAETCAGLVALYDADACRALGVMQRHGFRQGEYE